MARVEVTEHELRTGSLPPVCAKSGEPTRNLVEITAPVPHPRTRWLLLLGILPYYAWKRFGATRITARVPLSQAVIELRRRQRSDVLAAGAGGTAAALVGLAIPVDGIQVALVAVGLLLATGAQVVLVNWRRETKIEFSSTGYDTFELGRVHPAFRDALAAGGPRLSATPPAPDVLAKRRPLTDPYRDDARSA